MQLFRDSLKSRNASTWDFADQKQLSLYEMSLRVLNLARCCAFSTLGNIKMQHPWGCARVAPLCEERCSWGCAREICTVRGVLHLLPSTIPGITFHLRDCADLGKQPRDQISKHQQRGLRPSFFSAGFPEPCRKYASFPETCIKLTVCQFCRIDGVSRK